MSKGTADRLLEAAERRIRTGGYNGFSFRDLAADVGIKSASVHYHFPTKDALVAELTRDYADRVLAEVRAAEPGEARLAAARGIFRRALVDDELMCLCGVLAAEQGGLPEAAAGATRAFFEELTTALAEGLTEARAARAVATLEGAMLLARSRGDAALFELATEAL